MSKLLSILHAGGKHAPLFTPRGFLVRAVLLAAAFGIVHVVGLRAYTAVLSGSSAVEGSAGAWQAVLGGAYVAAYLGCVVVAPILVIAAGVLWIADRFTRTSA